VQEKVLALTIQAEQGRVAEDNMLYRKHPNASDWAIYFNGFCPNALTPTDSSKKYFVTKNTGVLSIDTETDSFSTAESRFLAICNDTTNKTNYLGGAGTADEIAFTPLTAKLVNGVVSLKT